MTKRKIDNRIIGSVSVVQPSPLHLTYLTQGGIAIACSLPGTSTPDGLMSFESEVIDDATIVELNWLEWEAGGISTITFFHTKH